MSDIQKCIECEKECKFTCNVCDACICEQHSNYCQDKYCNYIVCNEDKHDCDECKKTFCEDHLEKCDICDVFLCLEDMHRCQDCDKDFCKYQYHISCCNLCGNMTCEDHLIECRICSKNNCINCLKRCNGCGNYTCDECADCIYCIDCCTYCYICGNVDCPCKYSSCEIRCTCNECLSCENKIAKPIEICDNCNYIFVELVDDLCVNNSVPSEITDLIVLFLIGKWGF